MIFQSCIYKPYHINTKQYPFIFIHTLHSYLTTLEELGRIDPEDIRGNSAGFANFCRQFLAWDGSIGPLLHFQGKMICNTIAILKMKDPDCWDWVLLLNGLQNGDREKGKCVLRFSRKSVHFSWSSFPYIVKIFFARNL